MAEIQRTRFRVYRGLEADISHIAITDGYLYFATDTGNIYIDVQNQRKAMGGNGSGGGNTGLHYGAYPEIEPDEETELFTFLRSRLENPSAVVSIDDLIINSDGAFFRVVAYSPDNDLVCARIAVSGGGGGGAQDTLDLNLTYSNIDKIGSTYIYGQDNKITFYPSALNDEEVSMTVTIHDNMNEDNEDIIIPFRVLNNDPCEINTNQFPVSSNITITVLLSSSSSRYNYGRGWTQFFEPIRVVEMGIQKTNNAAYYSVITPSDLTGLTLGYIPQGGAGLASETLHVYIDGSEIPSLQRTIAASQYGKSQQISIPNQIHGAHTIELSVSTVINTQTYESDKISFQGAWAEEGNDLPIVWIGDVSNPVIQYTNTSIPYMIYNPNDVFNGRASTVRFYLNGLQISELDLEYDKNGWHYWDITDLYELGENLFTISCGTSSAEVQVTVTDVGARDLSIRYSKDNPQVILLNLSAAGRSNNELASVRNVWQNAGSSQVISTKLTGFNWANNGWIAPAPTSKDYSNGSYLSLANGAKVSISMPAVSLNGSQNYSFEFRMRVRNVQKYSTLVTQIPTYFYDEWDPETETTIKHRATGDSITMEQINANKNYTVANDEYGSPWSDEDHVIQTVNTTNGVILSWLNDQGEGIVIGTQEAFFKTPQKLVSVRYKEDSAFNLSFVVNATEHVGYIYLNGIPSGALSLPTNASGNAVAFLIPKQDIVINSDYADVDIYRIRMYGLGLTIPDVIHNYLADMHDLNLYDQNQLYEAGSEYELSYNRLVEYNKDHPDEQTMPYAVWKIKTLDSLSRETLPYYKGDSRKADITFVNPVLDRALDKGEITAWYYYTHSPSFYATDVDINVQGTSSQGYPRRNYKTKYKSATSWVFTHGPLAGLSVAKDHFFNEDGSWIGKEAESAGETDGKKKLKKKFHMDTEVLSTNKFTWKIDYMESSGTYNTGFANLMGNVINPLYNKHPLDDYGMNVSDEYRTTVYGYPVLVFHEYADSNQLTYRDGSQRSDGRYEYIGRYNMNLDKSSNEYYGFEIEDPHPFVPDKTIAEVSECWEMKNNWGTWCSLRWPDQATRENGFGTGSDDKLNMVQMYEVRYNNYGDQIEAILGEKLDYNANANDQAKFADEIGTSRAEHNHFLRQRYFNLEKLMYWADSTDLSHVTGEDIVIRTPVMNPENGDVTISVEHPEYVQYTTDINYDGIDGAVSVKDTDSATYTTKFYKDSVGYRTEKFRNEFEKHFDMHYCLVYFVLTELCLCFDSRGKNVMLASYGPQEVGGEYIWYPIFYDVDTQLGLNNSGSYLWDYDADVTIQNIFSTPNSVLWNNLYSIFYKRIVGMFQNLRGGTTSATNPQGGKLNYTNIIGAYECDPTVYDSYAMRGIRPIIAMGLDEYYKYFATTTASGIGYFDTEGVHKYEDQPSYAYCCQGNKQLTTELLLQNRLNYLDSQWLAGSYTATAVVQGGIDARMTLNNTDTSDNYLNLSQEEIERNGLTGYRHGDYPVPYFDALPGIVIKPYLKQYITYFMDTVPVDPKKYNDTADEQDGIRTNVHPDILSSYKVQTGLTDQIVYVPGTDYISSLGDLSVSYLTRFMLHGGKRLLDLKLGSDVPGYFNSRFDATQVNLFDSINDSDNKPLLKQVILSQLQTYNKELNLSGSAKLEEFRGLGSSVTEVVFATGAPLKIVHLPKTVISLELTQALDLTKILTAKPIVGDWDEANWTFTYRNPSTYAGLYIEDVTDNVQAHAGHALSRLIVDGSGLQYDLYKILDNLVTIKSGAASNQNLAINLKQIDWTPYQQVVYGEAQGAGPYYRLTDHSTYEPYNGTNSADWDNLTLNGRLYTKDTTRAESTITSLDLLDVFINDYANTREGYINQFTNTSSDTTKTYPTLAGNMFIKNTPETAIDEYQLTETYGAIWPDLVIRAEYINEAYLARYVQVLDSGKEQEIDVIRYRPVEGTNLTLTNIIPSKQYYDFQGWALDKEGNQMVATYDATTKTCSLTSPLSYSDSNKEYTLYAIFINHPYTVRFYDADGTTVLATTQSTYGQPAKDPGIVPSTDESGLAMDRTYKFKGYSRELVPINTVTDRVIRENVVNVGSIIVTRDLNFYAVYKEQSVYDEALDTSYFDFQQGTYNETNATGKSEYNIEGYQLFLKSGVQLSGKITLPTTYNNMPIYQYGGFAGQGNITHVFFLEEGRENIRAFANNAFANCSKLEWVDWPSNTRLVESYAFYRCSNLTLNHAFNNMKLYRVGPFGFNQSFNKVEAGVETLHLSGDFSTPTQSAFAFLDLGNALENIDFVFGGPGDPSALTLNESNTQRVIMLGNDPGFRSYKLYVTGNRLEWFEANATNTNVVRWTWFMNRIDGTSYFNIVGTEHAILIDSANPNA